MESRHHRIEALGDLADGRCRDRSAENGQQRLPDLARRQAEHETGEVHAEDLGTAANIALGAEVLSEGLDCFGGIAQIGFANAATVTGGGCPQGTAFDWVNAGLGNTKGAIDGTCRSCDAPAISRPTMTVTIAASTFSR